jgi:transcriptional regulator with GAF, ATPase, and Fis domain
VPDPQPDLRLPAGLGEACAAIARAIADSLDFPQILERVAEASRLVVPSDAMGVYRAESPDEPILLTLGPGPVHTPSPSDRPLRRADHSPRLWPGPDGSPACVADAAEDLDPAYPGDRHFLALGYRSALALPLGSRGPDFGIVWFVHRSPRIYRLEHAEALRPVTALVTLAVEHDHLRSLTEERRRKREALDALLPTLARALDVQAVIRQMSEVIRPLLAHDYMTLGLLNADGRGFRVHASTVQDAAGGPEYRAGSEREAAAFQADFHIARDYTPLPDGTVRAVVWDAANRQAVTREFRPPGWVRRAYTDFGIRSELRMPIWLAGERVGVLFFSSRRPNLYGEEDVELGRRVADHVALALAHERLAAEVTRGAEARQDAAQLRERVEALVEEIESIAPHRALGRSPGWKHVLAQATKVAETDTTVLITGESGTGKEVVARYIHRASPRAQRPFVALNCAALPESLLESELFGYERGAFTGAQTARAGRIEQAAGGVLFLDEVAEMSPPVQAKFLRLLQEREFQRLGGAQTLRADVRVIAATNRDPRVAMERGTLREDLYYRLGVFEITLPPLRERPEDILMLAEAFLAEIGLRVGRPAAGLSKDARDRLLAHGWPGNIRELKNAIERAVILCDGGLITGEHLPMSLAAVSRPSAAAGAPKGAVATTAPAAPASAPTPIDAAAPIPSEGVSLDAIERDLIVKAMAQARNNKSEAARLLGLPRGQLYSRLKRHGLAG